MTLLIVVAAGFVVVDRSQPDPLATLAGGSSDVPNVVGDGVLDILVIPGKADDPVVARLQEVAASDASIAVRVAEPFVCHGGLVDTPSGKTCGSWARSWPRLVEQYDPDTVVLLVDDWAGDSLEDLTGLPADELADAAAQILDPGLDLLTAGGANIVRASVAPDFAEAVRQLSLPFNQAMADLETARTDVYKVLGTGLPDPTTVTPTAYTDAVADAILTDASLYRRQGESDLPRIMVVGDSQAQSLGYGLERWAADNEKAVVWNRASEGCGLVVHGEIRTFGSSGSGLSRCRTAVEEWPQQVAEFKPDAVIVLSSLTDVQDRKVPGDSDFSNITDQPLEDFVLHEYQDAVDTLSAGGAQVIWMTAPCTDLQVQPGQTASYDSEHLSVLNDEIIPALVESKPDDVTTFDLASVMCPDGDPLTSVGSVSDVRPDGVHFCVDGALWFADTYGDRLLTLAGR